MKEPALSDHLADLTAALNAHLREFAPDLFGPPRSREPRSRYFAAPDGTHYFWTTERYEADADWHAGQYVSGAYMPIGPGSRSGRATRWELAEDSISGHRLRSDAKARALRLYRASEAGERRPWR